MEVVMSSKEYKKYEYNRTMESYISEWKAHNFVYTWFPYGKIGDRTRGVNFDKNIKNDEFRVFYCFF